MHVLVDYDSVRRTLRPGEPNVSDHRMTAHYLIGELTSAAFTRNERELRIRLYGGWLNEDGTDTEDLIQVTKAVRDIPKTVDGKRILVDAALSLLAASHYDLHGTYRERPVPYFRKTFDPRTCHLGASCSASGLYGWIKGRCPQSPSCTRELRDVLLATNQKMVDGMITSDLFTLVVDHHVSCAVVSNDDDMIPAILAAGVLADDKRSVQLIRLGREKPSHYDPELMRLELLEDR